MTPQSWVSKAKKVLGAQQNENKLIFSKNLSSWICPKVGSDYPRGTCENVVYHFHGTIQIIIPSYLRPVICKL